MGDDEKYLDPSQNPFIRTFEEPEPLKPGDPGFDDGRAPFADYSIDAAILTEKIAAAFPDQAEIAIAGRTFVRMADGKTFTEKNSGKSIGDLALADLLAINDFLFSRQKG